MSTAPTPAPPIPLPPAITTLVIAGGGPSLIHTIGTMETIEMAGWYNTKNIAAIYACSAGAIVALFFCLHRDLDYNWDDITEYIIHRPWENIFIMNIHKVIEAYKQRGFFNTTTIQHIFSPFFEARNIPLNITLAEFHKVSAVDLYFYAFELHAFKLECISWKTHPNIPLFEAIHMTCSLPIFMTPVLCTGDDGSATTAPKCYIDGGIITNYPIKYCLDSGVDATTILGFKNIYETNPSNRQVTQQSTLFDYLVAFVFKMIDYIKNRDDAILPYEILCKTEYMNVQNVRAAVADPAIRTRMLEYGRQIGRDWIAATAHRPPP